MRTEGIEPTTVWLRASCYYLLSYMREAVDENRTRVLLNGNQVLYRLSFYCEVVRVGLEPTASGM